MMHTHHKRLRLLSAPPRKENRTPRARRQIPVPCRLFGPIALMLFASLITPAFAGTLQVQVTGQVNHPGTQTLPVGSRLSDAVLKADVRLDAYPLGAAWLRESLLPTQRRWKAGLMYDADLLQGQARLDDRPQLVALAVHLQQRWKALPVTGRQRHALLDPRPLEISNQNALLANGDRILYPPRPATIRVLGAVAHPCTLPFVPMQAARDYLSACTQVPASDHDWLYIIQPDGRIMRRGIALWNREPGQPLAPGAIVYVPVNPDVIPASVRNQFNPDAVRFLSTQVLPMTPGAGP